MDKSNSKEDSSTNKLEKDEVTLEKEGVGKVIDIFLHMIMDIKECASEYIPEATERYSNKTIKLINDYENIRNTLEIP